MKVYRIKHLPSGLFFIPSRRIEMPNNGWQAKSNLSKKGKLYPRKPSLKFLGEDYYNHTLPAQGRFCHWSSERFMYPVVLSEWEIEEVENA